ncbi:transcriptional regulator [Streptomyces albiflavescens]|uniref:Transcriptional regulator n=1 Tax=Streptomyces albiflavescens TaxID=1623582 RepID=A0A917YCA2_9ACTN|nr:transcriptional regulator [Streptomyces albiflavescens]
MLSAIGWAVERAHPYACLRQLLMPVRHEISALPQANRDILEPAIAPVRTLPPPDPLAVQGAVLTLLQRLGIQRPVVVTVDDVQDCDRPSLDVLGSVLRHLTDDGVSLLLAARGDLAPPGLPTELPYVRLAPLAPQAAADFLDQQPGAPKGRRRLELLEEAQGNPLALLELCRLAQPDTDLAFPGHRSLLSPYPRPDTEVELAALPTATQHALLYAALAAPDEPLATVTTAVGTPDLGVWAPAEAAGVITVADRRIWFRHPLVRRAARARQPAQLRRAACLGLSRVTGSPVYRAQYQAAAALGPDESVAAALEETAWGTQNAVTAATALEQAAQLSPDGAARARRLAEALAAAHLVGDPDWVGDLYRQFTQGAADAELTCLAAAAMSGALSLASFQQEAFDLLLDVREHALPADGPLALALASVAAAVADQSALPHHRSQLAALFARSDSRSASAVATGALTRLDEPAVRSALRAFVSVAAAAHGAGQLLRRLEFPHLGALPDAPERLVRRLAVAWIAYQADEADTCLRQYRKADTQLRARKALGLRGWSLAPMADTLLATGWWAEAETLLAEGSDAAAVLGQTRVHADLDALAATLAALRGRSTPELTATGPNWCAFDLAENRATHARMLRARALAAAAQGDWARTFRQLRALFDTDGSPLHPFLSPRTIAELATAAQRIGREEEAAQVLAQVRTQQGERPTPRMTLLLHHATAVVDRAADPEEHFQLALVNPEGERWPWERARARLSYAVWLRRSRQPLQAREQLTAALEIAERLGAAPLAATVRAELRASGAAADTEPDGALEGLTAQQRQIVEMAADGLSNREIGEQLFLSPRTVGTHLYNSYPKLGVSRRHQLRDLLAATDRGAD